MTLSRQNWPLFIYVVAHMSQEDNSRSSVAMNCSKLLLAVLRTHFIISELLIQIRHFHAATRTDDNVTIKQLHCYSEMLLGNDLDNFQFLSRASRAVDQSRCAVADVLTRPHLLVDDVVIRFDIQLDSFRVSTSSAIAIRMLPVFRISYPSSTLAHHWLRNCASSVKHIHRYLLLNYAVSGFNRPIIDSFRIFQTCNRPTIDLLPDSHSFPDFTNSFSNSFDSSSRFVRLENHAEFGYWTSFDLTP